MDKLRISLSDDIIDIYYSNIDNWVIVSESIVGQVVFVRTTDITFSVIKTEWDIYKRNRKLKSILS